MSDQKIITWCTRCEKEAGSLCEVDEHPTAIARQAVGPPQVSAVRPDEVDHVCPVCFMNPGSETARVAGCECPILDNGRGHNVERMVVVMGCPVHHLEEQQS